MSDTIVWSAEGDAGPVELERRKADAVRAVLDQLGHDAAEAPTDAEREQALTRWVAERSK